MSRAFTIVALCVLVPLVGLAQSESEIVVNVQKVRSADGKVGCSIFSKDEGFPMKSEQADKRLWAKIDAGKATCTFGGIKAGTYAIAVFHDEDSSGKINTKSFGRPTEGWGVSNNVPARRFGPPEYDKAKFKYDGGNKSLSIKLIYPE